MEADGLTVGQTNVISPTPQSTDVPAGCPGPAGGGTHPCSLDKHKNSKFSFNPAKVEVSFRCGTSVELLHINTMKIIQSQSS